MSSVINYDLTRITNDHIQWPAPEPIAPERIIRGKPVARTLILQDDPKFQLGLWQITSGEFVTEHKGYIEYVHIIRGKGQLVDDNGIVSQLTPGVTILMQPGWKGRWIVDETIEKVYTVIYA